jgi:hypothetical protein
LVNLGLNFRIDKWSKMLCRVAYAECFHFIKTITPSDLMSFYDSAFSTYDSGLRYDEATPIRKKMMAKPKLELKRKTDTELIAFAQSIIAAMTGNAIFATPTPALPGITTKITAFNTKLADFVAKTNAARQAAVDKETLRSDLETLLTQLAGYVEAASAGDESKILSAGMQVRAAVSPVGALPAPANLNATAGDMEGHIDLSWQPVAGASSYEVECRLHTDTAAWARVKSVTASKLTVEDLTPGALYAFRLRAIGAAGAGPWSDEAVRRAP